MSTDTLARAHQEARHELAVKVARAATIEWARVDGTDIEGTWQEQLDRVLAVVTGGQLAAAEQTAPYLQAMVPDAEPVGELVPQSLAGVASDGRSLVDLLMYPVWVALHAVTRGLSVTASLLRGQLFVDLLTRTLIADAGRAADLVGMVARPAVTSYVRVVELPACARCIVLAGREYGISTGFQRHPRCDCTMAPVTREYRPEPVDASDVYQQMDPARRRKAFGKDGVKAIDDGADIGQVVNARRGMTTATAYGHSLKATTEGITKRGLAGKRLRNFEDRRAPGQRYRISRTPRLMPEEIYHQADDREHAIALLRRNGYLY